MLCIFVLALLLWCQELKLQILQSRLLADRQDLAGRSPRLALEVTRMIKKHPMVRSKVAGEGAVSGEEEFQNSLCHYCA